MTKKITIAIDGFTGTGKGTTARGVAQQLGYSYLDTGAMYRAAVYHAKKHGLMDASTEQKVQMINELDITWQYNKETQQQETYINGINREKEIRTTGIMNNMEPIVKDIAVREAMAQLQRAYGKEGGIVADGRDMGTVVYPEAAVKVFLECDLETRVQRRVQQLQQQGIHADAEAIRQETLQKDQVDYLGPTALGRKAPDAITIDTTDTTIDEQVQLIIDLTRPHLEA